MRPDHHIITEVEARTLALCIGCGRPTDCPSGLCCWHCFKQGRLGGEPLKYCGRDFRDWQRNLMPLPSFDMDLILTALGRGKA